MIKSIIFLKREHLFLFIVVCIAGFLRFWNITNVPPSLSHDEVAIGYNAYSILQTGRDEYGVRFPLLFQSFDDYKLPGMVYSSVISVALFGLNELGVRFPSAFMGTLTVFVFYFLTKELVRNKARALLITLFFAFSIWHINFSRQLFESNGALFFLLTGVYFLVAFTKKTRNIIFASFFISLSIYFYYSVRVVIPFILLTFLIVYGKKISEHLKMAVAALLFGIVLVSPLVIPMFSSGGLTRVGIVSILNDKQYIQRRDEFAKRIVKENTLTNRIIYNRRIALGLSIAENYYKNIDLKHIFIGGTTSAGLLYLFEAPFFLMGLYFLFKLKSKGKWVAIAWLFAAPFAGALTVDQPNPLRTLINAPMFSLISGLGFTTLLYAIKPRIVRFLFVGIIGIIFIISFKSFVENYFYIFPKNNALRFGDGYKQLAQYLDKNKGNYDGIYISGHYWRPYIFMLFWNKYDPHSYQESGDRTGFDNFYFGRAEWDEDHVGFYFADKNLNFEKLSSKSKKPLFMLAKREYKVHEEKFNQVGTINGKFAKDVFVVSVPK
ncbi:MAG: glycosyltransferase family 39 protein [Candidatus Levybacteria bacterium]|nr:glycosyltransferase family 39 protein [Candidatus Levybacteria bacterium]